MQHVHCFSLYVLFFFALLHSSVTLGLASITFW